MHLLWMREEFKEGLPVPRRSLGQVQVSALKVFCQEAGVMNKKKAARFRTAF